MNCITMAKLICLLVLTLAACMVAGLPHQDVNTMLHRTARAADPHPQYYGYNRGGYNRGYDYVQGGYNQVQGGYFGGQGIYRQPETYRPLGEAYEHCIGDDCHTHHRGRHY